MKKVLSNIILGIVASVCGFLFVSNIIHIIYLNQQETYDFNSQVITNMKENVNKLEVKVDAIFKLDNTIYSNEDLSVIKEVFLSALGEFKKEKLLKYNGVQHLYLKDLLAIDLASQTFPSSNIEMMNILAKYDKSINDYLEVYKYDFVSTAFSSDFVFQEPIQAYKYNIPDMFNTNMYEPVNAGITSRIYTLSDYIAKQNYLATLVLKIGGVSNE